MDSGGDQKKRRGFIGKGMDKKEKRGHEKGLKKALGKPCSEKKGPTSYI